MFFQLTRSLMASVNGISGHARTFQITAASLSAVADVLRLPAEKEPTPREVVAIILDIYALSVVVSPSFI